MAKHSDLLFENGIHSSESKIEGWSFVNNFDQQNFNERNN